jgi:serine/threonine-protein kinase
MSVIRLQSDAEFRKGIYYEFDSSGEPIGIGGMGKVYKGVCINEKIGFTGNVAIKSMNDDLPDHVVERARRESSIRLRNDNLVEMMGFIEIEEKGALGRNRKYYVVSELLEGVMLDDLLQGKTTDQRGVSIPFAKDLYADYRNDPCRFAILMIRNVLSGVMALHDAGYIHRDIDPTNIMVTADEHIKLIDFGIAKHLKSLSSHDKALTSAGQFMGKAWYAAPELVLGDVLHQSQTTDIYSIGILLFQFIVGHLPFEGATYEVLEMQLHRKMPLHLIRQKDIRNVVARATNKNQAERYQSASEFRVAVDRLANRDSSGDEQRKKKKKRNVAIILTAFAALSVLCAYLLMSGPKVNPKPEPEPDPVIERLTYNDALGYLKYPATAKEGLQILDSLSMTGDHDATFLLSRLYFTSKSKNDSNPDSIKHMQSVTGVICDNRKAHDLLKKTVSLDSRDYKALYELGCDYLGGQSRTEAVGRNIDTADMYLSKALEYAGLNNDTFFIDNIRKQMAKYKKKGK